MRQGWVVADSIAGAGQHPQLSFHRFCAGRGKKGTWEQREGGKVWGVLVFLWERLEISVCRSDRKRLCKGSRLYTVQGPW